MPLPSHPPEKTVPLSAIATDNTGCVCLISPTPVPMMFDPPPAIMPPGCSEMFHSRTCRATHSMQ
jgi:hypothetical protein